MNEPAPPSAAKPANESVSVLRYCTQAPAARAQVMLPRHLFTFLLEGEKTVHFAGAQVTVQPHQFVLLAAGNCLMSEKAPAQGADYHSLLLFFDNDLLLDFLSRHATWLAKPTQTAAQPFLLFEQDEFLANFIGSLDCLLRRPTPVPPAMQQVKLEELLVYLAAQYPGHLQQLSGMGYAAGDELLVRQAVTAHLGGPVTVAELAFLCHMSLSTFKRRFARLYGTSPNRWLLARRMDRAAQLLRRDDRKASELYEELGYENLSSFIHSFKQVHGMTPKQYQLAN